MSGTTYRRKPSLISAVQYVGENMVQVAQLLRKARLDYYQIIENNGGGISIYLTPDSIPITVPLHHYLVIKTLGFDMPNGERVLNCYDVKFVEIESNGFVLGLKSYSLRDFKAVYESIKI